jgi:glycosyltransferase involved in cell wall biosynthesis
MALTAADDAGSLRALDVVRGQGCADLGGASVALAHDYLNQRGGAERVLLQMAELWPQAPIYTTLYDAQATYPAFDGSDIRTSYLDVVPMGGHFRALLPMLPSAIRGLGPVEADVLIASSSGWAHGIRAAPGTRKLVYCHTPARWLHTDAYRSPSRVNMMAAKPLFPALRRWDRRMAQTADLYIANSRYVRERIRDAYGIDAQVVYPPVDLGRFRPTPAGERLLVISRLLNYKRVDLAIEAANLLGLELDIVGSGPEYHALSEMAGKSVVFHGDVDDGAVNELLARCSLLIMPGTEDFGITPLEAHASGKPVVAFGAGGALETVIAGENGLFFDQPTAPSLADAIQAVLGRQWNADRVAATAQRFSQGRFQQGLSSAVASLLH